MTLHAHTSLLRSLHVSGSPLVLPNAWDAASARAVVAAGFPVVATTSGGVAATLGYEDHEGAPASEMLAAATRIASAVEVPVTVDAEAGYGMPAADLATALMMLGAAGFNLEDTDHRSGGLREPEVQARRLADVRSAAAELGYDPVINARIDVFLTELDQRPQRELVPAAAERARAYLDAGVDCVFPIALWEDDALAAFTEEVGAPVNVLAIRRAPSFERLAELGVARISWGSLLHRQAGEQLDGVLAEIAAATSAYAPARS
jgi:2-methylisocitrate lyase-like PEP mutase family enzyme